MKLPLKVTIISTFTVFTATTIAVIAILNYIGNRDAILLSAKTNIEYASQSAELGVNQLIERALRSAHTIAHLPSAFFDWRNPEPLLVTLSTNLQSYPQHHDMYVGFPDGAFIEAINLIDSEGNYRKIDGIPDTTAMAWRVIGPTTNGRGRPEVWRYFDNKGLELIGVSPRIVERSAYDPRTQPWFMESQRNQVAIISDVYVFESINKPGITLSAPAFHRPSLSIGIDLSLNDVSKLVNRLKPGENGTLAVIADNGNVVAHQDPRKIFKQSELGKVSLVPAAEIDDPLIQNAMSVSEATKLADNEFKIDGKKYLSFFHPSSKNGITHWSILSIVAVDDFTGSLMETLQHSLLVAGAVLIFAVISVSIMAGWIARPISQLRNMSDQITQLDFSSNDNFKTPFDEIHKLRLSMNKMKNAVDTFLRYVPREVVHELIDSEKAATVSGVKREVTMLFTDVQGFTTMTESMTPEEVMSQVSTYLENLSFGIQANMGTIDKFIGDAIMAIWNAPTEDPNHINNACRGMLTSYHISEELNKRFIANGQAPMRTRFGLHCGDVLVGNVGTSKRLQYTCLGSHVNLAARIEGLNKFYGTQLLVSDTVRRKATSEFLFRLVDIVEAKGTTVPLKIYELMGERKKGAAFYVGIDALKMASRYEQAFDFYLHRNFSDALNILRKLVEVNPNDPVVAQLTKKCECLIANPPLPNWNGVTVLNDK